MAMQKKAWMMGALFNKWINHFLLHIGKMDGISNETKHLLIMDKHTSHVPLNVVHATYKIGIDVLTIPNHASHAT
jgi:hypothetical protein